MEPAGEIVRLPTDPQVLNDEEYRKREMGYIRSLLIARSANNAAAMSLPILASVLAFVTCVSLEGYQRSTN